MGGFYINVHVHTTDQAAVKSSLAALFAREGFKPVGDEPAADVVDDDNAMPDDEYGVIISCVSGSGWVSVYVDDWRDSGVIARGLSASLATPVLEVWVADDVHWGYTYYESGEVRDRFADDPATVAETPEEAALYHGQADVLSPIQTDASIAVTVEYVLREARASAGQFAGIPVEGLATAVGLPFEHAFTGYEYFFHDDPDDYAQDLEDWAAFRHLAFRHPDGKDRLVE